MILARPLRMIGRWLAPLVLLVSAAPALAQLVKIESPADKSVSHRDRIAVIVRGRSGFPITLTVNGTDAQTLDVRPDMKADFLNVRAPAGPVVLRVAQQLPGGFTFADSVRIHVVGPAAKVLLEVVPSSIPADSLSQAEVKARVVDQWGMPLADGQMVTVQIDRGTILTTDIYPDQPGVQVQVQAGAVVVHVLSSTTVGTDRISVTADGVTAEAELDYTLPHEQWMVTGTAVGQVGWRRHQAPPAGVEPGKSFDGGSYADGKAAFFARGTLSKGLLLTASYDSDRRFNNRVFRYLTPERFFPIYGDASSIFYEAPSASRLFVRLTRDRSSLQFGNFATDLTRSELIAYNRTFTGVSSVVQQKKSTIILFGASTDQAIQVDQVSGEGISGLYYLSAARRGVPIVEGSERVVIQTRDRLHSELVLKEEPQYRFTDYEIDYDAGTLLFKRPVPSHTPEEHPIIILATYETARAIQKKWVGGGRLALHPVETWEVGTTVVGEERMTQSYWLTGVDTRWQPVKGMTLTSELARSSQGLDGWAWKVGTQGRLGAKLGYDLYYRDADRQFDNPSSPTAQPGVRKVRGRTTWSPGKGLSLNTELFRTDDDVNREKRVSAIVGTTYRVKTLTNQLSVEDTRSDRQGRDARSTIFAAGSDWAATPWLTVGARRDQSYGDKDVAYRPTLNRLRMRLGLSDRVDIVGEHAFRDGGARSFFDSSFTAVGIQSRLSDDLKAYANYELDGGINGQRNQAIVGLRHRYKLRPDLTLHSAMERVRTLRGDRQGDFYAFSLAGEYLPKLPVKGSVRYEQRNGVALDKIVASGAFDLTLAKDFTFLAKHTYLDEQRVGFGTGSATTQQAHHFLSGLAYRATAHDYLSVLGKYEYKYEDNSLITPATTRSTHIGSVETILEPKSQVEWFVRYGFKVSSLSSDGVMSRTLTDLWMTNVRYEWRGRLDVLGEYRLLFQHTARDYRHGAASEVGVILQRNARMAVGYNFAGYHDQDFAGTSYWAHGPYMKVQVKFTESTVAGWLNGLQSFWR
ncbi:MAG: hypothetical protein HY710_04360 [Candidatus Latescibacteria bacterium]|nr:hypothetical protein [Candidatus Latescibacterota bacterium]